MYQLATQQRPVQLQASHKIEIDAGNVPRYAKRTDGRPLEMDAGNVPVDAVSGGVGGRAASRSIGETLRIAGIIGLDWYQLGENGARRDTYCRGVNRVWMPPASPPPEGHRG